ncbi:hypothetical protein JGH11_11530 [Dysgonomonas sp. Marseille-P4677]|uniref:hypothetical protein n=1 Tax=Dysgonomonas sp. Marseille-P4677 TaxID=2364790 RepID=UPI0019130FAD|nr:hypothetical protein [Dysgonomonas sp. Marseille-P4677]MBK5721503.1 hypothetical protein [Dysgonomonas sp. Marseille-P4677]
MKRKTYSIAGLKVLLTGARSIQQVANLPGFDVFETNDQSETNIDIFIHLDQDVDVAYLSEICHIYCFKVLDIEHSFSICKEGYLYEMRQQNGCKIVSIIYSPYGNKVYMSSCSCEMYIKYAMWIAFSLPMIREKVLPIHASTIVKDQEAVLFLGESGTGKSTHTRLWLQYIENTYLLNDDSPLLRVKNDKIFVCGSPWSGKTHCYRQEIIPLKAVVRLRQYPENKISRSDKLNSIGIIYPSFPPFLAYDVLFSEKMIQITDSILKETPVYELKCLPNKQAAEIASSIIY